MVHKSLESSCLQNAQSLADTIGVGWSYPSSKLANVRQNDLAEVAHPYL